MEGKLSFFESTMDDKFPKEFKNFCESLNCSGRKNMYTLFSSDWQPLLELAVNIRDSVNYNSFSILIQCNCGISTPD